MRASTAAASAPAIADACEGAKSRRICSIIIVEKGRKKISLRNAGNLVAHVLSRPTSLLEFLSGSCAEADVGAAYLNSNPASSKDPNAERSMYILWLSIQSHTDTMQSTHLDKWSSGKKPKPSLKWWLPFSTESPTTLSGRLRRKVATRRINKSRRSKWGR
ncbi:conserved hypothetical protein [Coccidioides posadasii str. Silveira]|uniref:Uncharacterized protein n=1 Tax=Coccidioides posadasii (strain RMSCC 757 / Silveira) TaxID=443226 RepID=E9DGC6_COCPS|nr:conserved hypothetical protein [Coccidioides posadasii str. Silveira]